MAINPAKRFFNGKPCRPFGHIAERYVSTGSCVICIGIKSKADGKKNIAKATERKRRWYSENRDKQTDTTLRKKYGISLEQFNEMAKDQNNACFLCLKSNGDKRLVVDHCHTTLKVRRLLCDACNHALGGFFDNPEVLRRAADYLEEYRK